MHRDTSYVSYFSSNGPAADGRLKPELVAPGNVAVSAASAGYSGASSCGVVGMSGTSMATPAAAGMEDCPFSHLLDAPFLFFFLVLAAVDVLISNYHLLIIHRPGAAMLVRQYLSGSAANGVGAASSVFAAHQLAVAQSLGWNTCLPGYACGGLALAILGLAPDLLGRDLDVGRRTVHHLPGPHGHLGSPRAHAQGGLEE